MTGLSEALNLDEAAALLADAFFGNPAHIYIYPDEKTRRPRLEWLMRTNLKAQRAIGVPFGETGENGRVEAVAFWHRPGAPKASLGVLARYGFFSMPFRHGFAAFARMLHTVNSVEERRKAALQGRESWYLNNMVVAAAARGKGLGSVVLRRALRADVDGSGAPASLTTQKPENVRFYEGLGFHVADDRPVKDKAGGGFDNWVMIYEPR